MQKMRSRLEHGIETGALTASQFELLGQCCDVVVNCMNRLDEDPEYNVGLVHTDIINGNIIFTPGQVTLIDFSRSVYSYYLYDLAQTCFHSNFGGSNTDLQNAILRGYHSVKPLKDGHLFMMQAFFAMFIMMIMAEGIDSPKNGWRTGVLKWFAEEIHPGLTSGKVYMKPSVYENVL